MFFFALALSCVVGLAVRIYLNPDRIKRWVTAALSGQGSLEMALDFDTAHLRLSRGAVPQLGIEISNLKIAPHPECRREPSLEIARLSIPLSFFDVLRGRVALGTISAEDMKVDLDGLKERCSKDASKKSEASRAPASTPPAESVGTARPLVEAPPKPWWTPEQLAAIQRSIEGAEFARVEVLFEEKTKKVYLESFSIGEGKQPGTVLVESDLRIPPELTYGEKLPLLRLRALAREMDAEVNVRAALSEGHLSVTGNFQPAAGGHLDFVGRASVDDVPLSTLVPLFSKAGIVQGAFHPRFLWLDCQASIQGLLTENPLKLENCEINGRSGRVEVRTATRRPDGKWDPFEMKLTQVDLGHLMETFEWMGPEGILHDYGRLSGTIDVREGEQARFAGHVEGAQFVFSSRNVRAHQKVSRMSARLGFDAGRLEGDFDRFELDGGEFDGKLEFTLEENAERGTARAVIDRLRLSPEIQKLLVGGSWDDITGKAQAKLEKGRLTALDGHLEIKGLNGRDVRLEQASVKTQLERDGEFSLVVKAPRIDLRKDTEFFAGVQTLFFQHEFESLWVPLHDALVRAHFPKTGGLSWDSAQGTLESGRIRIVSEGSFNRDRELVGWIGVDYPAVKKLKWLIGGTLDRPALSDHSKALLELRKRENVTDVVLGLPVDRPGDTSPQKLEAASTSDQTAQKLRSLGEKVIRRAKGMIPAKATEEQK